MQWKGRRKSSNISHRGRGSRSVALGGGGLLLGLIILLLTGDPMAALQVGMGGGNQPRQQTTQNEPMTQKEQDLYDYSAVVLADTEDAWNEILKDYDVQYREPKLHVFKDSVNSGCGLANSGMGPFYCSADETIYMDLSFYDELINKFGADKGDFILSYVISHEVAHHVQNVTGILGEVHQKRARVSETEANELTVRLELQADYLAGVVARYQKDKGYLDPGDIDEAISAAWSIGDDTIQKKQVGYVIPESFTHGTSDQRSRWYKKGYDAGNLSEWDSFSPPNVEDL